MSRVSSFSIILIVVALFTGAAGGYVFQHNNSQRASQTFQSTIDEQENLLSLQDQELSEHMRMLSEYNATIQAQLIELYELNQELTSILEEDANEPNVIAEKEEQISTLENEIKIKNFEILRLQARLGDRLDWKEYRHYDFSFEYPEWMDLTLLDNDYYNGILISVNWIDPFNYFYYYWNTSQSLDTAVNEFEEEQSDMELVRTNIIPTTINGHDAALYHYNVTIGDGAYYGILCIWECSVTERINILFQYSNEDPLTSFFQILSTIKCHSEGDAI
jgi:hypothetical protein